MNEHNYEKRNELTLEKGEKVALCRCWQSKKFPFCDGSHRELSESVGPVIVHAPKE